MKDALKEQASAATRRFASVLLSKECPQPPEGHRQPHVNTGSRNGRSGDERPAATHWCVAVQSSLTHAGVDTLAGPPLGERQRLAQCHYPRMLWRKASENDNRKEIPGAESSELR